MSSSAAIVSLAAGVGFSGFFASVLTSVGVGGTERGVGLVIVPLSRWLRERETMRRGDNRELALGVTDKRALLSTLRELGVERELRLSDESATDTEGGAKVEGVVSSESETGGRREERRKTDICAVCWARYVCVCVFAEAECSLSGQTGSGCRWVVPMTPVRVAVGVGVGWVEPSPERKE